MDFVIYEHEDYLLIVIEEWVSTSKIQDDLLKALRRRGYKDTVVYFDGLLYYGINNPSRFLKADYVNKELVNGSLAVFPIEVQLETIKHFLKYPTIFDNPLVNTEYDQILEEFDRISTEILNRKNKENKEKKEKKKHYIKNSLTPAKNLDENNDNKKLKEELRNKKKDVDKRIKEEIKEKKKKFEKKKKEITEKDEDKKGKKDKKKTESKSVENTKNKEMGEDMNKKQQERRKRERREQRIREKEEREMREEIENMEEISMEEAFKIISGLGGGGATISMGFGFVDDSGDVHEFELSGDSGESLLEQVQEKLEGEGVCTCHNCTCEKEIEKADFEDDYVDNYVDNYVVDMTKENNREEDEEHMIIPAELIEEVIIEEDGFGEATMVVPVELGLIIDDMLNDGIPLEAILDFLFGDSEKMLD